MIECNPDENGSKDSILKKRFLLNLLSFINDEVKKTQFTILVCYLLVISIFEILAYKYFGIYSIVASRMWLFGGLICFLIIMSYIFVTIKKDFLDKNYVSVIPVIILTIILFAMLGNIAITEISPEASLQVAAGMESFEKPDLNYAGTAFLGYPNRQYIISALPAKALGRTIFTQQLGFAFPFLLGLLSMYFGLRKWIEKIGGDIRLSVIPILAILVFPFVTEYFIIFEQTIYPISFTMIGIGFFLSFICKPNILNIFAISWIGCLLSNCYTPALASLGLLLVFIAVTCFVLYKEPELLAVKYHNSKLVSKILGVAGINIIIFFLATLINKRQDRSTQIREQTDILSVAQDGIFSFITDKDAMFMGFLGFIVLTYLLASLFSMLRKKDFIIAIWVTGVFVATFILAGYTSYQPAGIMQRALVVVPVLMIGISIYLIDWLKTNNIKIRTGIIIILMATCSINIYANFQKNNQSFLYINYIQPMKYMFQDLEKTASEVNLAETDTFNIVYFTDSALRRNPKDYTKFFYPNARIYAPENRIMPENIDLKIKTIIYSDSDIPNLIPGTTLKSLSFKNEKHKETIILYRGIIN
jgi:hypothetical protein